MSSQAKLNLRPPPHVNFIQGYPGIPSSISATSSIRSRPSAHIAGTVEVRLGSKGLKASWLRIELRKLESVGGENWGELIGRGPIDVWTASNGNTTAGSASLTPTKEKKHSVYKGRDEDDEDGWETLTTADFPFHISIPEGLPPTARIDKQSSISYEIVTSLCVLTKKGLLRKESAQSIIQSTHPIALEKHELHSTWPIYHIPEEHTSTSDEVSAKVFRSQTCYSPGDTVSIRIVILSNRVSPVKLKNVSFSIRETVTFKGLSQGGAAKRMSSMVASSSTLEAKEKAASQRTETIAQKSKSVGKKMYKGDNQMLDLQVQIPKTHSLMTIRTAKHIEVAYTLRVHVDLAKNPIIIDHLPVTICNFSQSASKDLVSRIGYVEGLSDTGVQSTRADSLQYDSTFEDPRRRMSTRRSASYTGSSSSGPQREMRIASGPSTPVGRNHAIENQNQFPFAPRRNDTVYTTASTNSGTTVSGPGVAGRGATGAVGGGQGFSWGQYGAAQPYTSDPESIPTPPPVRSAFAGPGSIYNGNDGTGLSSLTNEERKALAHHSVRPQSLAMLGGYDPINGNGYVDNRAPSFVPGQIVGGPPSSRLDNFGRIEEGVQGFKSSLNTSSGQIGGPQIRERTYSTPSSGHSSIRPSSSPNFLTTNSLNPNFDPLHLNTSNPNLSSPSTPNSTNFSATPTTPNTPLSGSAAAEAEKMRLYERARQQAERNQRRADEKRAKAANGTGSVISTMTTATNRSVSSPEGRTGAGGAVRNPTISSTFSSNHQDAEAEKMRLYERARKQAEKYQAGYKEGASFPDDDAQLSENFNHLNTTTSSAQQEQSQERPNMDKRASANFWMTPQAQGQGGNGSGKGSNDTSRNVSAATSTASLVAPIANVSSAGPSSKAGTPLPPGAYPSAEEEKRRLYEAAKAETEAHLRQESSGASGTSSSNLATGSSTSASGSSSAAGSSTARPMSQAINAVDEKAQMKRFYEAQDEVARHQRGQSSSTLRTAGPVSQVPYETAPVPSYQLATSSRLSVLDGSSSRPQTSDSTSQAPSFSTPNPNQAVSEKEQLRLYYAARDAQQNNENQASGSSSSNQLSEATTSNSTPPSAPLLARPAPSYASNYSSNGNRSTSNPQTQEPVPPIPPKFNQASTQNPQRSASVAGRPLPSHVDSLGESSSTLPPSFASSSSSSSTPNPNLNMMDEKAQMKAYYEAKDLAEENSRNQGHSKYASSADIYASSSSSSSSQPPNNIITPPTLPPLQFSNSTTPTPPSLAFNSVLSPIPASAISASSSGSNPNSFNHPPPPIPSNPYAPRRAKSDWEELEADDEVNDVTASSSSGVGQAFKPPLPPKTPVMR